MLSFILWKLFRQIINSGEYIYKMVHGLAISKNIFLMTHVVLVTIIIHIVLSIHHEEKYDPVLVLPAHRAVQVMSYIFSGSTCPRYAMRRYCWMFPIQLKRTTWPIGPERVVANNHCYKFCFLQGEQNGLHGGQFFCPLR